MIYCIRQLFWRSAIAQKLKENCRVNITGVASPSWVQKPAHCLWHYQSKRRKIVDSQLYLRHLTRTLTFFPVFARESDVFWAVSDMRVHSIYRLVRKCKKKVTSLCYDTYSLLSLGTFGHSWNLLLFGEGCGKVVPNHISTPVPRRTMETKHFGALGMTLAWQPLKQLLYKSSRILGSSCHKLPTKRAREAQQSWFQIGILSSCVLMSAMESLDHVCISVMWAHLRQLLGRLQAC